MATDYDAPRVRHDEEPAGSPEQELTGQSRRSDLAALGDEMDPFEAELDINAADMTGENLTVQVLPRQSDEFTCTACWLVYHRSQLVSGRAVLCRDCAL